LSESHFEVDQNGLLESRAVRIYCGKQFPKEFPEQVNWKTPCRKAVENMMQVIIVNSFFVSLLFKDN